MKSFSLIGEHGESASVVNNKRRLIIHIPLFHPAILKRRFQRQLQKWMTINSLWAADDVPQLAPKQSLTRKRRKRKIKP